MRRRLSKIAQCNAATAASLQPIAVCSARIKPPCARC